MENFKSYLAEDDTYGSEVEDRNKKQSKKAKKEMGLSLSEEMSEEEREELEDIADALHGASKMHKKQAKKIEAILDGDSDEDDDEEDAEDEDSEEELDEGKICDAGINYVIRTDPGGKDIKRGEEKGEDGKGKLKNWSARAAQIASKYCKDPDYGKGRGKDAKDESIKEGEGGLEAWEKENWTHSDGSPCGDPKDGSDGSESRCKPASKWKTMDADEKAADNKKKKAGTKAGKQYVPATKKGKVTKSHTKRNESAFEELVMQIMKEEYESALSEKKAKKCWPGYEKDPDIPRGEQGSCVKKEEQEQDLKDFVERVIREEVAALEIVEEEVLDEASKCTKVTKKASSTRKGKKWMKCVKSDSGGYKRIHWGQAGVRVTGKSGNTKRKKSFKARHNCGSAKSNTPQGQACKDWAE